MQDEESNQGTDCWIMAYFNVQKYLKSLKNNMNGNTMNRLWVGLG
jgi:hypothetical protein